MPDVTNNPGQGGGPSAPRVLFYSHDTFGLGHLRRSRALASAITSADDRISAIILTGSPVAGRFTFPKHVDHIRLPGVTKNPDGSYASEALGLDIDETTELRAGLIKSAAMHFNPDILIVDKEPTGFRGELIPALDWLRNKRKAKLVLGLRDVLDEPDVLAAEWERKGALVAAEKYYDEIWVYGLRSIYDPTAGLDLSPSFRSRMKYTGYLHREELQDGVVPHEEYVLVTPGGGGDGAGMVNLVLSAYEQDPDLQPNAKLVYGPFLSGENRAEFEARVEALNGRVQTTGFDSRIENLIAGARGIVSMGGYNTFCEVLSFDKPAVIVPRTKPRLEQYIRANRAEELGLVRVLDEYRDGLTVDAMIKAIRALPSQPKPSAAFVPGLLDGLDFVSDRALDLLGLRDAQGVA
ncbi:glycosyltransferase family protein [Shimia sediminis]|uniref:glycosyltransferase family protein n=1 Tax=Shimia sediminis TaxID=2497945 RepID=UPI003F66A22F